VHLVAVFAHLPVAEPDACVIDQHVEPVVIAVDRPRERADLVEGREISGVEVRASLSAFRNVADDCLATFLITAVDDHCRAQRGTSNSDFTAKPVRGAGHHHNLVLQ
jgi:hypothetical protein